MAKLVTLSLARLSLKNIPTNKLIIAANIVIFISLFAIFSSIISLFYEKKIEELNKQLTNEQGNEIIYNHWLSETPKNIRNIESLLSQISREDNYLIYLQSINKKLITDRDITHNPTINMMRFIDFHFYSLDESLRHAVIVSSKITDINNIRETKYLAKSIRDKYIDKTYNTKVRNMLFESIWSKKSEKEQKEIHNTALVMRPFFLETLDRIIKFNIDFNLNYYSQQKSESKKKTLQIKNNIKEISKKESNAIFIAFLIQIIIFLVIQFFEFGFEIVQNRKK